MNGVADALSQTRLFMSERPDWGSQSWTELFARLLMVVSPSPQIGCMTQANVASSHSAGSFPESFTVQSRYNF